MNGEEKCTSPCRVKFYWSQKIDGKIVFSIDHPNYKSWSDTIRKKPSNFNFNARINLERKVPFFKLDKNAPLIDFNKLIAIFQDGTVLGKITHLNGNSENIEWSGHTKIGENAFKRKFYFIADKAGLTDKKAAPPHPLASSVQGGINSEVVAQLSQFVETFGGEDITAADWDGFFKGLDEQGIDFSKPLVDIKL